MDVRDKDIITLKDWGGDIYPKLSWFKQDKVETARIMVVGCGALGNEVLKNLVLFGIRQIVVVDYDRIEFSNLTRSVLFSQNDAEERRYKVEAVAEQLKQINPQVRVSMICGDITHDVGLGILRQMDVVIGCVDNRYARYCLNRMCMRTGVPWIDGGIEGLEGTVRVFAPGKNCYACNLGTEGIKELSHRLSCSSVIKRNEEAGRVPTTPVIASIIGAVQVQEAMKWIHKDEMEQGKLTSLCGKMFYYEGQHLTSRIVEFIAYDKDCPVHELWEPVHRTTLTSNTRIDDSLSYLADELKSDSVKMSLQACFVDYLVERESNQKTMVMLPEYDVAHFVEQDGNLRYIPFSRLYQHEIRTIGSDFPYSELTLGQVGIPEWDILHVLTNKGDIYVEMDGRLEFSDLSR